MSMTKREWLVKELGESWVTEQIDFPEGIDHYYKGMHDYGMGVTDCDDWAWLNTLFRYDIGAENAKKIIGWYYENEDTTVQDAVSVEKSEELWYVCDIELGIHLDFSHWPKEEPTALEYGFNKIKY